MSQVVIRNTPEHPGDHVDDNRDVTLDDGLDVILVGYNLDDNLGDNQSVTLDDTLDAILDVRIWMAL